MAYLPILSIKPSQFFLLNRLLKIVRFYQNLDIRLNLTFVNYKTDTIGLVIVTIVSIVFIIFLLHDKTHEIIINNNNIFKTLHIKITGKRFFDFNLYQIEWHIDAL